MSRDPKRLIDGTSATGAEILGRDWSGSPLGPIEAWPASLRAAVNLMLACPTPMYLAWGDRLVSFFNDAYRPVLGYRLAGALGRPFEELWGDIWDDIGPLVDATLRGESRSVVDMKLDLRRTGVPEESWWTFTYSPAYDEDGRIVGLLCVTSETTGRVLAERERRAADQRLELALSAGQGIGLWDWDTVADLVYADARFALLYGVDPARAAAGAPLSEFFGGIHPEDRARVGAAIARAKLPGGGPFLEEYRLVDADGAIRWVVAQGYCIFDEVGRCIRFPGASFDISDRKAAEARILAAKEEREFVLDLVKRQRALAEAEAMMRLTSETMARRLGVARAGFVRMLHAGQVGYAGAWSDGRLAALEGARPEDAFGEMVATRRRAGQILISADCRREADPGFAALAAEGVRAAMSVPVVRSGTPLAGFYIDHVEPRRWTPEEIALIREVAEITWLTVERAEAMQRLEERVVRTADALAQVASDLEVQSAGRREAESHLRQLQKMEAVGQLSAGIAHDFNNMLAVVIGGLNLLRRRLERGDTDVRPFIDGAMEGANRAAELTQRLLAFSRQQPLAPEAVDGNALVEGLRELLVRTLGETIRIDAALSEGLWRARADPNQLESAILNLVVNARDAMPEGGRLTIETANVEVDEAYARDAQIEPGAYVMLAVSDTGSGMTPEVMARAFEPFFTTKGVGKGTGLGLSQVFGFARQSGGHVRVYSEPGSGSTFRLYLPRFLGEEAVPAPRSLRPPRGGSELVLVVEDESRVRAFTIESLRELGYSVVEAASGPEALELIDAGLDATLLFTDVVMPEMTGRQLADAALLRLPHLKVLYTTGYARNAVVHNGVLDPGTNFLPKPFGLDQLAAKVREVLDDP